jgi:exopolysaccharide biosynthesis polyprenyl glycosylphosphotransferase
MARRGYSLLFATGLFLSDILAVSGGYVLAFALRFHFHRAIVFMPPPLSMPELARYAKVLPFVWLVTVLCYWAGGLYRESLSFRKIVRAGSILKLTFYAVLILSAFSAFYREVSFSRIFGVLLLPCFSVFVFTGRWLLITVEELIRRMQGKTHSLIFIGSNKRVKRLADAFCSGDFPDMRVLGFVSIREENPDPSSPNESLPIRFLGSLEELERILDTERPDEVIVSTFNLDHARLTDIVTSCDRRMIQFYIVPDVFNFLTSRVELTSVGGINLIGIQKFPLDNGLNRLLKRLLDLGGSLTGLVALSWLFAALAVLIKATSRGPVFYRQVRCHEDGREFTMLKFRTMVEDAEQGTGPVWASEKDRRCTRIGAVMRRFNLDELPQLINVFRGDMSLVGPRPERPHFISRFKTDIPRYMARHSIKPGITGWAQVNGWRGNTSLEERIKYDLYYIENWSVWLDIKILFLTLFSFKNAY